MKTIFFHDSFDKKVTARPNAVLSVDFTGNRFATAGIASSIKIWEIVQGDDSVSVEFIAELNPVEDSLRNVNVVRWSPGGTYLASGSASGVIIVWRKQNDLEINNSANEEELQPKEQWVVHKKLMGHSLDVLDLAWSPLLYTHDSKSTNKENATPQNGTAQAQLLVSVSFDCKMMIWDPLNKSEKKVLIDPIQEIKGEDQHKKAIQGVAWDPLGHFIATQSCDKSVRIYEVNQEAYSVAPPSTSATTTPKKKKKKANGLCVLDDAVKISRCPLEDEEKKVALYRDEQAALFSRKLQFATDGSFLATVTGQLPKSSEKDTPVDTAFLFARNQWKRPISCLPGHNEPIIGVRFSPVLYKAKSSSVFNKQCEYKMVYCVMSKKNIMLYDTQSPYPIAVMKECFSETISDAAWSADGNTLIVSNWDGYCCIASFEHGELGEKLVDTTHKVGKWLLEKNDVPKSTPLESLSAEDVVMAN
jgi:chromatin assembly factor 1 subunit B